MKRTVFALLLCLAVSMMFGCSVTHKVAYPPADDLYITMGDDPGSESQKPYTPKGTFIHVSNQSCIPFPVLGLIPLGNAEPQHVFENEVYPQVREMGGDALTSARIEHVPPAGFFSRLLGIGCLASSHTIVTGQVVKR